jgi:hypothetical protein
MNHTFSSVEAATDGLSVIGCVSPLSSTSAEWQLSTIDHCHGLLADWMIFCPPIRPVSHAVRLDQRTSGPGLFEDTLSSPHSPKRRSTLRRKHSGCPEGSEDNCPAGGIDLSTGITG